MHCHDSKFRNPVTITSLEIQVWSWKIFWTIKIWCSSLEMLKQVNHQVAVIVDWHTTDKAMMEERQDTKYKIACCRIWNRWQYEIYYWRRFRTRSSWQNQRNGTSREVEFDEALQEAFYKDSYRGDFDELEVEFLRGKIYKCKRQELVIKNKSSLVTIPSDVSKGSSWGYAKQWPQFENISLFQVHQVL